MSSEKQNEDRNQQEQYEQHQQPNQQQQQSSDYGRTDKPELTAEWTVHAQLTISRPNSNKTTSTSTKSTDNDDQQQKRNDNTPVTVFYKWSTDDCKTAGDDKTQKSGSFHQEYTSDNTPKGQYETFHKPPSDSGFSSSNTSRKQAPPGGARCRSTCSIVLSAIADFLPTNPDIPEEPDPFYFNTTASYTISPEKGCDETSASQNFNVGKILALRDAFCQTSDTETQRNLDSMTFLNPNYQNEQKQQQQQQQQQHEDEIKRKPYDYKHITDPVLVSPVVDEGNSYWPSYPTISPARSAYTSPPFPTIPPPPPPLTGASTKSDQRKPPRTVHIDVYCTGSDAEDDDDDGDDEEDDSSSSENRNEMDSNSTPQTVLNTEQMLLRHQRAGKDELPRRFAAADIKHQQTTPTESVAQQLSSDIIENIGHAVTKSNTVDEVNESKKILFKKHLGDQRSKFNLRNKNVRKDPSDDCLSSDYPNSSRSTMRDFTCSSLSSTTVPSNIFEDVETSWKETELETNTTATSIAKSDSFEYDNSIDRLRIRKMERFWAHPEHEHSELEEYKNQRQGDSPTKFQQRQQRIQDFLQSYRLPTTVMRYHFDAPLDYDNLSETDHSFLFDNITIPERDEPTSDNPLTTCSEGLTQRTEIPRFGSIPRTPPEKPPKAAYLSQDYSKSGSETSTMQSNLSGYTSEYLAKARKFGAVVTALRKPGHHVGPAKNPECQCEHCRRWMEQRTERGRGRAFSVGDLTTTRNSFVFNRTGL